MGPGYYSIDVNYNSTWVNVYNGYNNTIKNWVVLPIGSTQTVSAVRIESTHAMIVYLFEMQFAQDHQIPTPVYAYPNKSIYTTRNSQVIDSSNNLLTANTNRTQQVTSVGSVTPTFMSAQNTWPWCVDHNNYSSDAVICNNQTTPSLLEYTLDLENYSNICDMSTKYAIGDTNTMISYGSVYRIYDVNGTYYLQIGNSNSAYDDSNYSGIIFKSTDKGSTWTEILKTKHGMLTYNVVGNRIIAGEYHSDVNDTNAGRNIYYSTDGGNTFVEIYNYGNFTANGYPNHFHNGYPIDDNTVYCGYGDQINSKIWKLTRPANWDGVSNWTLTEIAREQAPMYFCLQGNTLYVTRDGGIINAFGDILKIDIASDTVEGTLHMAEPLSPGTYAPYSYQNALRSTGGIISYNGVLYTTFFDFSSVCNSSGFITSADGNNWTYLFRNPYVYGIKELCGVANIGGDDTLIGAYMDQGGNMRVIGVPIPSVMTNTAICVQNGFVNRLARINVGSVNDQWYKFDNTGGDGCGVQINALTGYGMQYSAYNMNNNPPGQFGGQIYFNDNWEWAGNYPNHNDLISLSFMYQTSPLFSAPTYDTAQETTWGCYAAGNMFYTDNTQTVLPMTTDWEPFNWWNEVNDQTDRSSMIFWERQPIRLMRIGMGYTPTLTRFV